MKNEVQLITYVDRLSGGGLRQLTALLRDGPLAKLFGGVHLLPFFHPIDGADAGFDPIDHTKVDPRLGDWHDVKALAAVADVMSDVIVNHMSSESPQFHDFSARGAASPYAPLFLTLDAVFPRGATERDLLAIYRPRPGLPFTYATLKNGEKRILWTTFTSQQVDIAVEHACGKEYLDGILRTLADNGVRMIRLDAAGYAIKKAGDSCFMMPETFAFIADFTARAHALGIEVLVEIHSYYRKQIEIAKHVDWVYDFALPPLLLHAIFFRTAKYLTQWLAIRPRNALTVLDTHDGIGVIDIGADATDRVNRPGLVPPQELDRLVDLVHEQSRGESRKATGAAASNLDLYQVNCTFYDALGANDAAYLLARAVQLFVPGVPQIYYVGLLAGRNDMLLLERTKVGRDINRHYYSAQEVAQATKQPVVQDLFELIRLRNAHGAFAGEFSATTSDDHVLTLRWQAGTAFAQLAVDFHQLTFRLEYSAPNGTRVFAARCLTGGG
jgi:sucrose phosphorylase